MTNKNEYFLHILSIFLDVYIYNKPASILNKEKDNFVRPYCENKLNKFEKKIPKPNDKILDSNLEDNKLLPKVSIQVEEEDPIVPSQSTLNLNEKTLKLIDSKKKTKKPRREPDKIQTFTVPAVFFNKNWTPNSPTFKKGWTQQMNTYFEKFANNKCVLKFNEHALKYTQKGKKGITPFIASAECKMSNCLKFKFIIKEPLSFEDHQLILESYGTYNHLITSEGKPAETHRRKITGEARAALANEVSHQHPCTLANEKFDKEADEVLIAGNLNNVPNEMLLGKIASEHRKKDDLDKDFNQFLFKLTVLYKAALNGRITKGFIQGHTIQPDFSVTLFMEDQITVMIEVKKDDFLIVHFDATGKVLAQPPDVEKRIFYYCMIIPGSVSDKKPSIPALEFITSGHSVRNICANLDIFVENLRKNTTIWPLIDLVEVDFSKALIQATCKSFNNFDIQIYLDKCFLQFENPEIDQTPFTTIHVCSSHLIKSAIKRIKNFTPDEDIQLLMRSAVGLLIHSTNFSHAKDLFKVFLILFGSEEKNDEEHNTYVKKLKDVEAFDKDFNILLKNSNDTAIENQDEAEDLDIECEDLKYTFKDTQRETSKFYQTFFKIKDEFEKSERIVSSKNNLYNPRFITYLIDELLPYYPIWSGSIIKKFNLRRHSNACVESWNKYIKHFLFNGKMRQLIPRAIMVLKDNVIRRIRRKKFNLQTSRQNNNALNKKIHAAQLQSNAELSDDSALEDQLKINDDVSIDEVNEDPNTNLVCILEKIEKSLESNSNIDEIFTSVLNVDVKRRKNLKRKINENCNKENVSSKNIKKVKQSETVEKTLIRNDFENQLKNTRKQVIAAKKKIEASLELEKADEVSVDEAQTKDQAVINVNNELPYDLHEEEWKKRMRWEFYQGGFKKFQKNFDVWEVEKNDYPAANLNDPTNEGIQDSEDVLNTTVENNTLNEILPWASLDDKFVESDCHLNKNFYVSGVLINEDSLKTLLPGQELDDNIINAFLQIVTIENPNRNILVFDLNFLQSLKGHSEKSGYYKWAHTVNASSYDVWIIPKRGDHHWSLIVIIFSKNVILHLDSLHRTLDISIRQLLCTYIETVYFRAGKIIFGWDSWTLHNPTDIPNQGATLDCGVHVGIYAHIILTSADCRFSPTINNMTRARKWMFKKLLEYQDKISENQTLHVSCVKEYSKASLKIQRANIAKLKISRKAPENAENTFIFCKLIKHICYSIS